MRILWFIPLLLISVVAAAENTEQCGLYQIEDYGDQVVYTLSDFSSQRPMIANYRIKNFESAVVATMIGRLCYCVRGTVTPDPIYPNDPLYKTLEVTRVIEVPAEFRDGECKWK